MRAIFENVTIGERHFTVYEIEVQGPHGRRRSWDLWENGKRVLAPTSRVKVYDWLRAIEGKWTFV